ncbi:MAG: hypothetical protein DRI54_03200, partial [Bacteroidetes bacterium]
EVDFDEVDLSLAVFKDCDLLKANFIRSILKKTDFRSAYNYAIDPELNKMEKARFSKASLEGLLMKYNLDLEL